ncbi:MAG: hypothetical protein J2P57_05610, partial [Acidimicrobiaceae bacterium]|nr:hypothetical protein [Acidimicrobiaceae bacterium]
EAANELDGPLRAPARVVEQICSPEQVYVCSWAHAVEERKHLHIVVQPVTRDVLQRYGGLRSEQLQAEMMRREDRPSESAVKEFSDKARQLLSYG